MRALLLASLVFASVAFGGEMDDYKAFPTADVVAHHFTVSGAKNFSRGVWKVTFGNFSGISGDMAFGTWDVTITGKPKPSRAQRQYRYRLTAQVGHMCDFGTLIGTIAQDGSATFERIPPFDPVAKKQQIESGECPEYALRIWRIGDTPE